MGDLGDRVGSDDNDDRDVGRNGEADDNDPAADVLTMAANNAGLYRPRL